MDAPVEWMTANPTSQEVLTDPIREGSVATAAVPGQGMGRRRRFGRQWSSGGRGWGTLMRHFLLSGPVAALSLGVGGAPGQTGLIATPSIAQRLLPCFMGTVRGAVAVAAIAVAANQHGGAATGTEKASSGRVHWRSGPMDVSTATRAS